MHSIDEALVALKIKTKNESLMRKHMRKWFKMYQGLYEPYIRVRTNAGKITREHKSNLMLEKLVCDSKAKLLLNEKYKIIVTTDDNGVAQKILDDTLEYNSFTDNINTFYELDCALGVGATFYTMGGDGETEIRYVDGFSVYPITVVNNKITECAFVSKDYINGDLYYKVTTHTIQNGNYIVENILYNAIKGKKEKLNGVEEKKVYGKHPTFHIYRPTSTNHIDLNSCFGVSIFSTAEDVISNCNYKYSSYLWEFQAGKKRVMVASQAMKPVFNGKENMITRVFDTEDTVYQELGQSAEPFVKEINMTLRVDEHTKAINDEMNFMSVRCGFGNSYFTFDGLYSKAKTATEVISKNQELIAAIQRDRLVIEKNLIGMAYAILEMHGIDLPKGSIHMTWDDSIFEDESKRRTDILLLLREGHVDKVWALQQLFKLTEEEAKAIVLTPIDDLLKEEQLVQMKAGLEEFSAPSFEEKDIKYNDRDKPDKQFIDDNDNGI